MKKMMTTLTLAASLLVAFCSHADAGVPKSRSQKVAPAPVQKVSYTATRMAPRASEACAKARRSALEGSRKKLQAECKRKGQRCRELGHEVQFERDWRSVNGYFCSFTVTLRTSSTAAQKDAAPKANKYVAKR